MPGTQKGYSVVVDPETRLATVVEVWFSGYTDRREVQRQIDYGYVEEGGREAGRRPMTSLSLSSIGAHARNAGACDIRKCHAAAGGEHGGLLRGTS